VEFSRQEYWSGLPFPSPGDLPNPGIKPGSPTLQVDSLLSESMERNKKTETPVAWQLSDGRHSLGRGPRSSGCEKSNRRVLAPDGSEANKRNNFSDPRLLCLPIHRKVLHSLTWDTWFSLMNNNLLMLRLPAPCCKLPCKLAPRPPSLEQFSQVT